MRILLTLSILLNLVLGVALTSFAVMHRRVSTQLVADATAAEVRLQQHILDELDDPENHEELRAFLERNIENGVLAEELWRASAE